MDPKSSPTPAVSPVKQALIALEQMRAKVENYESALSEPLAIVGVACRFPQAENPRKYWNLLEHGVDAVGEVPLDRWNAGELYHPNPDLVGRMATRWGGFLDQVDRFDPAFFGISPREALSMDPQHRLFLEVVWEALESSGQRIEQLAEDRTGVFVGITGDEYAQLFHKAGDVEKLDAYFASGIARSVAGGRISYVLGLHGPNLSIDTACSSSLVAIHTACLHLRAGECRTAIAGGVNVVLSPEITMAFSRAHMMAADGRCKAFDSRADGFVRAEGCGVVVLKRLRDARADGDHIWALIRGSAVNQDGRSSGLTVPSGPAQERVLRQALSNAGVEGRTVSYIEAHGTGTSLGDPIEAHALAAVYGEGRGANEPLVVGSVKTNIGHLESAAGVAGLIKVVLSLQEERIPAHLHFERMNPHIDWKGMAVEIPVAGREWKRKEGETRRAGVSAFGFSGTNAHVILEEAPLEVEPAATGVERPLHLLTLSAREPEALAQLAGRYMKFLEAGQAPVADICYTANTGRGQFAERLTVVGATAGELAEKLRDGAASRGRAGDRDAAKSAWLFTGQGAQYPGMGRELYETQPVFRAAMERCAAVLEGELKTPLLEVLYGTSGELLEQTAYTQPALFALEWSLAELWRSWGVEPSAVLGHSVGEYVAACVAGVYGLEAGLKLMALRGRLMQELPAGGAMVAVQAEESRVRAALAGTDKVSLAAVNGPASVVISGEAGAVEQVEAALRQEGIETQRLVVSHAFHSACMDPLAETFGRQAAAVPAEAPRVTLISSVTGKPVGIAELSTAEYWQKQVRQEVRFQAAIEELERRGYRTYVEIGPGPVLCGMGRNCVSAEDVVWAPSLRKSRGDWPQLLDSLGALYRRGTVIDWAGFDAPYRRRRVLQPTYPFQRQRYWVDLKAKRREPAGHPMLGPSIEVADAPGTHLWNTTLSTQSPKWLADHRVHGMAIVPLTAYLELMTAAMRQTSAQPEALRDVIVQEPLALTEEDVAVQVVARGDRIEVRSKAGSVWKLHASARRERRTAEGALASETAQVIADRLPAETAPKSFYDKLTDKGHAFGPSFRLLESLRTSDREALGRVELQGLVADYGPAGYLFHPAALDACIQVLGAVLQDDDTSYMPLGVDEVRISNLPGDVVWSHVRVSRRSPEALRADIRIFDETGGEVANIAGLELRRASLEILSRAGRAESDVYFATRWEPAAGIPIAEIAAQISPDATGRSGLDRYESLKRVLDPLCSAEIARSFATLGLAPGAHGTAADLARRLAVVPKQQRLFVRLLQILAEDGQAVLKGDQWEYKGKPDGVPDWETPRRLFPEFTTELTLTARCAGQLAGVLNGTVDPLQLLFPAGKTDEASRLYSDSPTAKAYNGMMAQAVRQLVPGFGEQRNLRVLEIGGGTGGTTVFVAPELTSGHTEYTFTDISPLFVERARERFAVHDFLSYKVLDIERDPEAQGFSAGSYDLIVAANVLHATADLGLTMKHVRKLLAPGGALAMLEVTRRERWIDVTFGMTEGWWLFTDNERRPDYPLLDVERWRTLLEAEGLTQVSAVEESQGPLNTILLAAAQEQTESTEGEWLIVGEGRGLARQLSVELTQLGASCVTATELDDLGALAVSRDWRGVVHLASLDSAAPIFGSDLEAGQRTACGTLLDVVNPLAKAARRLPRVWLVTAGAQPVEPSELVQAGQATAWGLARTLLLEAPDTSCVAIDLDPATPEEWASNVLRELRRPNEEEVAWRGGRRYAARLQPVQLAEGGATNEPVRLAIDQPGELENIRTAAAKRRKPGAGEIEIEVETAGIGFRDVLNALGAYPGDPGPLGGDCAGRVVSTGPGVEGLRPGDEVLALAPGCHDGFVLAPAALAAPRPAWLTAEAAATLPIPFVTAIYTLETLGRIRSGDRVLIHAGTGGVGLAAIQMAQLAGAEVFATAGTADKRAYLRSLGVRHVFSSRDQDFVRAVLEATGGAGVDVVLNSLSGDFVGASLSVLARGGRFLEIGKRGIWTHEEVAALERQIEYHIVDWSLTAREDPGLIGGILARIVQDLQSGRIRPLPARVFDFRDAVAAYRLMAQGRHVGRIVLRQNSHSGQIRKDATYLITGGTGGLGLKVAQWLVKRGAENLVLTARHAPSDEVREQLGELERQGVRVRTVAADAGDRQAMAAIFEQMASDMPPLGGVIHAAGYLEPGVLGQQDWDRFRRVQRPKVDGAWYLHELTKELPLDFFVLFSSIASVLGAPGQANHAAASAFEDALAHHRRSLGLPAVSINWGAWAGIGAAAGKALEGQRAAIGVGAFTPEEGIAALERILLQPLPQVAAARLDWNRFAAQYPVVPRRISILTSRAAPAQVAAAAVKPSEQAESFAALCARTPAASRLRLLEETVHGIAIKILGFGKGRKIEAAQPLQEIGLDSLMAVEFRNALSSMAGQPLPVTLLFSYPAIEDITRYLATEVFGLIQEESVKAPPAEGAMNVVDSVADLSDEEVDRLIAEKMGGIR